MNAQPAPLSSYRDLFDIPRDVAYLNNASYSPLPRPVREAGVQGVARKSTPWTMDRADPQSEAAQLRAAAARLIGAQPDDIAITNAVAYGIATAAANLVIPAGHRILMIAGEFPSLAYAWARIAEERGAVLDIVPRPADHDWTAALEQRVHAPGPPIAVAALTPVVWTDGTLVDIPRLAPALKAQGAAIVVDATQAAGVLPVDVHALAADYLVFPTYKWVLGPYTLAFLYVAPHRQDGRPLEQHGAGREGGAQPFPGRLPPLRTGAARFDMGEHLNPVSIPMALAGMALLHGWTRPALEARLRGTTDALADVAAAAGFAPAPRHRRSPHILGLEPPPGLAAKTIVEQLEAHGVFVADRGGLIRAGAHIFNDPDDVDRFAQSLREVSHERGPAGPS